MSQTGRRTNPRRPLFDRVLLRFPWPAQAMMRFVARRPPRSRLRRELLEFALRRGFAAVSRRDTAVPMLFFEPDCETAFVGGAPPGMAERYQGHDGYHEWAHEFFEQWGEQELKPLRLIDLGDRLVVRLHGVARGTASGAEVDQDFGYVYRLSARGRVSHLDMYWGWQPALEAAGVAEE